MTEEEAKTKECCGPQVLHPLRASPFCAGSACMAWRIGALEEMRIETAKRDEAIRNGWRLASGNERYSRLVRGFEGGYCGLAGAPQ